MSWQELIHDAIYCSRVHDLFASDVKQVIVGDIEDINCGLCLAAMKRDGWGTALLTATQETLITRREAHEESEGR